MMRNAILISMSLSVGMLMAGDKPEKGFKPIFNGKDLTGWTKAKENDDAFQVKDGAIVANGKRCHLYYTGKPGKAPVYKDFELKVDVMTRAKSNGGIYFHTVYQEQGWPDKGFEVQVNNSHGDWKKTGGIYNVQDNKEPFQDDVWFTEHIVVKGNHVQVFVNDKKVSDWTQPADWKGPQGNPGRVLGAGTTFAFQAHDPGSTIMYKNVRVKVLK